MEHLSKLYFRSFPGDDDIADNIGVEAAFECTSVPEEEWKTRLTLLIEGVEENVNFIKDFLKDIPAIRDARKKVCTKWNMTLRDISPERMR